MLRQRSRCAEVSVTGPAVLQRINVIIGVAAGRPVKTVIDALF